MSNSIPSDTTPRSLRGSRFTTNSACLPSISRGLARSCFIPATMVRVWSPKFTLSCTSLSEPAISSTRSMVPTRMSTLSRSSADMGGFTGAMIMPELFPAGSFLRVIAGTRPHLQFAVPAGPVQFHFYRAERAILEGVGGIVGQDVLVANVVGDLVADGFDFLHRPGEVGQSSGGRGQRLQALFRAVGGALALLAQQADGVDHRAGLLRLLHGHFQRLAAGIVLAVGDHQQDLLVARTLFQMVQRANHRIEH